MDSGLTKHQDYLLKKDSKGKWTTYWVCLECNNLLFYEEKDSHKLFGSVELCKQSKCIVTQRKTNSYRFMVTALHGRHLFKCQSAVQRHRWITTIQRAVQDLSESHTIPKNEADACERTTSPERENVSVDENDVLPLNVILVTSFPAVSESPTHPFRVRPAARSSENGDELDTRLCSKPTPELYLFTREPATEGRGSCQKSTGCRQEEERNILDLRPTSPFCDSGDLRCQRLSPRQNRSFPCTPEKGERSPKNSLNFMTSSLAKSRSLNFLQDDSSPVALSNNVRFSRHMVKGGSVGDVEL